VTWYQTPENSGQC